MTFNLNSDDPIENGLVAAGGNSRAARSARAKLQRRDKYGRWVEMGGGVSIDVRVGGKNRKIQAKFVGGDPKSEERGLFVVENEEGIPNKVYSLKMKATKSVLASLKSGYLEEQGIKDPNKDVNNNYIGKTLDKDIEDIETVDNQEIGELDEFLAKGKMDVDAFRSQERARLESQDHESYNVVATLDEADTPDVLDKGELKEALEKVGVETEAGPETPEPKKESVAEKGLKLFKKLSDIRKRNEIKRTADYLKSVSQNSLNPSDWNILYRKSGLTPKQFEKEMEKLGIFEGKALSPRLPEDFWDQEAIDIGGKRFFNNGRKGVSGVKVGDFFTQRESGRLFKATRVARLDSKGNITEPNATGSKKPTNYRVYGVLVDENGEPILDENGRETTTWEDGRPPRYGNDGKLEVWSEKDPRDTKKEEEAVAFIDEPLEPSVPRFPDPSKPRIPEDNKIIVPDVKPRPPKDDKDKIIVPNPYKPKPDSEKEPEEEAPEEPQEDLTLLSDDEILRRAKKEYGRGWKAVLTGRKPSTTYLDEASRRGIAIIPNFFKRLKNKEKSRNDEIEQSKSEPESDKKSTTKLDKGTLTPSQLGEGYGFDKTNENSWLKEESGFNGESYQVSKAPNGKWYVTELSGNGPDNYDERDLAEFDNPQDAFEFANNMASTPRKFDDESVEPIAELPEQESEESKVAEPSAPSEEDNLVSPSQIEVGDEVKTPNGEFKKVIKKFSTDSGDMLTFEDNTYVVYDNEDRIEIKRPKSEDKVEESTKSEESDFKKTKEGFENLSEEEKAKPADQRNVQHWYVDETGNIYPDREDKPAPPAELVKKENERFWNRETNRVYDGNGKEILFTPTYDDKFVPIPKEERDLPNPVGESRFWDRNQIGVKNPEDAPQYVETDEPQEIVDALAEGKFVRTSTLKAGYDAIKLAISRKFKPRNGDKPSKEELDDLKYKVLSLPEGQQYQIKRAIDLDSLTKEEVADFNRFLESTSGQLTPEQMAEVHTKFRNQPIDLTNLKANGSNAYSQNNAGAIREEMPPLASFNRPIFEKDLDRLGIGYTNEMMQADDMKPLQAEMSMDNVAGLVQAMEDGVDLWKGGKSRIYVDREGNVLDGHHRWAAVIALQWKDGQNREIPVTRIDLPRDEALALMNEWANSRGIPGQKLVDNRGGLATPEPAPTPANEDANQPEAPSLIPSAPDSPDAPQGPDAPDAVPPKSDLPEPKWDKEKVKNVLDAVATELSRLSQGEFGNKNLLPLDIDGFRTQKSEDIDVIEDIDMAYYISDLIERSGNDESTKSNLYQRLYTSIVNNQINKASLRDTAGTFPGRPTNPRQLAAKRDKSSGGATINPYTLRQPSKGIAVAVENRNSEVSDAIFFDPMLGDLVVADYIEKNKDLFDNGFKLGLWHDKDNNEMTLDVVEIFAEKDLDKAEKAGKDRKQQGIFRISDKEFIPTDGDGDRGRARKERESQREIGDGSGAGRGLGQPDSARESGEGQTTEAPDAGTTGREGSGLDLSRPSFETLARVPIADRPALDYEDIKFDLAKLNARQRQIIKKLNFNKQRVEEQIVDSAKKRDTARFTRAVSIAKGLASTIKRVFGESSEGKQIKFGSGEKERLKNITFFSDSEKREEQSNKITELKGLYVAKNGETYLLSYSGRRAAVYQILPNGNKGEEVAYVDIAWYGENSRGPENPTTASIAFLSSSDESKGLGGVAVTFARYVVESSGMGFAHSNALTPQGANNSKGIEPGDPRRHHYSQSEKILYLMGAPTMKLMERAGWFTGDYEVVVDGYVTKLSKKFVRKLDMSGRSGNSYDMHGPIYKIDQSLQAALNDAFKNNVQDEFLDNYKSEDKDILKFASYRLQFLIEELNWKDGPSKEEVIEKLRKTEEFLLNSKEVFRQARENREYRGYGNFGDERGQAKLDVLVKNLTDLREALESDKDFDSRRMDRPDSIDLELPNKIDLGGRDILSQGAPEPFIKIPYKYGLHQFTGQRDDRFGASVFLTSTNYSYRTREQLPPNWTNNPASIARRFTSEQIKDALENSVKLIADEPDENETLYGKLNFARQFSGEDSYGYVDVQSLAKALYMKSKTVDGVEFEEYLAELVDRSYGTDENIKKIDEKKANDGDIFLKMDEYLSRLSPEREDKEESDSSPTDSELTPSSVYKDGKLVFNKPLEYSERQESRNEIFTGEKLINERFDLPNELGGLLAQDAPEINMNELDELRLKGFAIDYYNRDKTLAAEINGRYSIKNVLEAFKDAIENGNTRIRLEVYSDHFGNNVPIELDIRHVRDSLQLMGVDTNGFIRQEILPNLPSVINVSNENTLSESQISALRAVGLDRPRSVQEIIEEVSEVVNVDNFEYQLTFNEGASGPELWKDPATGKEYVVKRYSTKLIAQMEVATQALYRAAGVYASTPRFGKKSDDSTGVYVVTEYVPGSQNHTYRDVVAGGYGRSGPEFTERARTSIQNGLAVDLWLDNIDGPFNGGNVLITEDENFIRIDGGGGLLADPTEGEGDKKNTRRYQFMDVVAEWRLTDEELEYQKKVMEIAKRDGSFEGDGILFGYEYYLNQNSWHWNSGGGMRPYILSGFDEDSFREKVRATLLDMTPDKINELIDGMPIGMGYQARIKRALISRRAHILNRFGIVDTYNPEQRALDESPATESDRNRLDNYINNSGNSENSELQSVVDSPDLSKGDVESLITSVRNDEEIFIRPGVDFSGGEVNQPEDSMVNLPEDDYESIPDYFIEEDLPLDELKVGDVVEDSSNKTYNGKVVFNTYNDLNGMNTIGIKDSDGKVRVFTYNSNAQEISVDARRYTSAQFAQESQIDPGVKKSRDNYLRFITERSNKVIDSIKEKYPAHVQLRNGDLRIASRVFITRSGKTYKYELVVHRKENEEFVAYVREWEIDRNGERTGEVRVNKITNSTHSPRALLNQIAPLIQGNTRGKGIYGNHPRNWFNQGRFEDEVTDPRTGLQLPRSLAGTPGVNYIEDTGIEATGDSLKDAVISYIGRLVSRGVGASEIYRRLHDNQILSPSKLLSVIETIEANRAFPGMNQIPYLSRNGKDVVRVGDRVRHYAPDGTFKDGVVRRRRDLSVNRKPNGEYAYTDVLVVKFDGRAQGTPIVAKNLEILSRADGNKPDLAERAISDVNRNFRQEDVARIPANWTASFDPNGEPAWVRFQGPEGTKSIVLNLVQLGGEDRYTLEMFKDRVSAPVSRGIYFDKNNAISAAENMMRIEEELALGLEPSRDNSSFSGSKPFDSAEGVVSLDDIMDAVKRNQESGSCSLTAAAINPCKVHEAMARTKDEENNNVTVSFNPIEGVDASTLPVYKIYATRFGRGKNAQKVVYWTNPNDVGNPNKRKTFEIKPGISIDQAVSQIVRDAEDRINYLDGVPEGKTTRTLTVDLGDGVSVNEELDYETWLMFSKSPISKKHFSIGENGTIQISESRKKYYKNELAYHLSGVANPPSDRKPTLFVLGGSPASGKGGFTNKKSALAKLVKGLTPEVKSFNPLTGVRNDESDGDVSAVLVDPDVFKVRFPEVRTRHFRQLANRALEELGLRKLERNNSEDQRWANDSHEESSLLAKLLTKAALDKRLDVVLDAVNAEKSKIAKKAAQARENGYSVVGRYIEAPFERTMPDAAGRSFLVGREVPIPVQLKSMDHLTKALRSGDGKDNNIWEVFDEFELFHREGGDFKEIATWRNGQEGLTFLGRSEEEIEEARKLHDKYLEISSMSDEDREQEIIRIRGLSENRVKELKDKSLAIKSEEELDQEEAVASEVQLELFAMMAALEKRYPGYSTSALTNMLRDLIVDLDSGKLTEKELVDLITIQTAVFKKEKDKVTVKELRDEFRDRTKFYKSID